MDSLVTLIFFVLCGAFGGFLFFKGTSNFWLSVLVALISFSLLNIQVLLVDILQKN